MTILCYHEVSPDWSSPMSVSPDAFADHCRWLARHRTVIPLRDAVSRLDQRARLPRRLVSLTFDDGFAGVFEHALPVLARTELPATVFLVANTLPGRRQRVDWVDDPPATELQTLTLDQVAAMRDAGVTFESHSYAHHDLTRMSFEDCVRDLRESRELLESVLGHPVRLLAYPRGRHNASVRAAAERAGYSHAFTLPEVSESPGRFAVPRVGIYRGNGAATLRLKTTPPYLDARTSTVYGKARRAAGRVSAGAR